MDVQPYTLGATDEEGLAIWLLEKQIAREKANKKPSDDDYESEHRFLHGDDDS